MQVPEFIHLDQCNFVDYPPGGTLSFTIQMRKAFGNRMAIAGIVTDDTPCGYWVKKEIDGITYDFFGIAKMSRQTSRPLIPARVSSYVHLKRHMSKLKELGVKKIFTRTPQFMLAFRQSDWNSICFCFAGTANSVAISRYPFVRWMGGLYERLLFKSLADKADCIFAAADERAINCAIERSNGVLKAGAISKFPTRFDDDIFHPQDVNVCRQQLGLPVERKIITTNGRLCWVKGWQFVLDSFRQYQSLNPDALLIFIGDGEDRQQLEHEADELIKDGHVRITGRVKPTEVSRYLAAADLVMVGSYEEGWSNAMIEALACAKPIVSTNISGAHDMILPGENGYILYDRNPVRSAEAMEAAMGLPNAAEISRTLSMNYSMKTLCKDFEGLWLNK